MRSHCYVGGSVLALACLSGCGGGGDSLGPEQPFPEVGGSYQVDGGFDGLTRNDASFTGTVALTQASLRPLYSDTTRISVLADSTRFALSPASYRIANDPPFGGFAGYLKEILTYPLSQDQLIVLGGARKVRMRAADEEVDVNVGKLTKGAGAIALALGCQRPL